MTARKAAAPKPDAEVNADGHPDDAPGGERPARQADGGGSRGEPGPGRPGGSGCRRCQCSRCGAEDQVQLRSNLSVALLLAVAFALILWNDLDIKKLARTVEAITAG
jgi:hypothetical protein